jgi:putative two-component system response regulator
MSDEEAELILNASPMHDIGKIGIPDNILSKPGKLDAQERAIMEQHTLIGARIIGEHNTPLLDMARTVALTHHEKWDGTGYPRGIKGENIPLVGRIVAVADVFDALVSKRPYKKAWPAEKAVAVIKEESGKHFDPEVVKVFLANLNEIIKLFQLNADPD